MTKKALITLTITVLFCGLLASSILADSSLRGDRLNAGRPGKVSDYSISPYPLQSAVRGIGNDAKEIDNISSQGYGGANELRRPLGATSANLGEGIGESISLTHNDYQACWQGSRQIAHWWNGLYGENAEVSVHFSYNFDTDTLSSDIGGAVKPRPQTRYSGYNVYDATALDPGDRWPRGQDDGCNLQTTDTAGWAISSIMDMMYNGRAVISGDARTAAFDGEGGSERIFDTRIYYQGSEFNCTYSPYEPINVTWIDSTEYRDFMLAPDDGIYLGYPQVVTQLDGDGTSTIVHLIAGGDDGPVTVTAAGYGDLDYFVWFYWRKVGDNSGAGDWEYMQIIDTTTFVYYGFAAADYPNTGVAVTYANPSATGIQLVQPDQDVFCRESFDRGMTWQDSYSITNYDNASEGSPNHFTAMSEANCFFDSEGDLHAYWIATRTSADPYNDGFNWNDFDGNLYHWEKANGQAVPGTGDIVKVANGTFLNDDMLTGTMNFFVCGFGGSNSSYVAWSTMGECDGNLYLVWSQMHERANRFDWRTNPVLGMEGILDDCSYEGNRGGMANWEILMSVARLETSSLWDYPRNITNTYTPNCGLLGDEEAETVCASEWHPKMEKFALDETGLDLFWPEATEVDMTPLDDPAGPYSGGWYLNMEYIDDQYPGPAYWGGTNAQGSDFWNPPSTLNSIKWLRLACVEPIEASRIAVTPQAVLWPEWVQYNTTEPQTITVRNEGNVVLKIKEIGAVLLEPAGSWLTTSENPTPEATFDVTAGVVNTNTFDININTAGITEPTWMRGYIWLKSDAVNNDSLAIRVDVLAADTVEPTVWDTVMTHQNMLHPFLAPVGTCVALAVGNMGELGWGGGSDGRACLDYQDASGGTMDPTHQECDTAGSNRVYLVSATPFVILADDSDGSGAELTQSFNDRDQADATGFDPTNDKGSLTGGANAVKGYDSAYTGRFVNRDTSIAMERIVYGPRSADPANDIINFMIVHTKVYSGDGQAHDHVTIGNVADYDIPSDNYNHNLGGFASGFVYMQGTDTIGHDDCASHVGRYAAEVFGGGYTSEEWALDNCANSTAYKGLGVIEQLIMVDSTHNGGVPVTPSQPNPLAWWNTAAVGGLSVVAPMPDTGRDLATFLTYKHDYNLAADDTLHYWTVMTTTPIWDNGLLGLAALASQVSYAKSWYTETVRGCDPSCCVGRVGDANGQGDYPDEVTLGDIMLMVDVCFISNDCTKFACPDEADVNQSGGASPLQSECLNYVTLGDIMTLVDFLFITGPDVAILNTCL